MAKQKFINNYSVVLHAAVLATDLTIDVSNSLSLPALSGGDYYILTLKNGSSIENVKVTAVSAQTGFNRLTVQRGVDSASGGIGKAFAINGSSCAMTISAETFSGLMDEVAVLTGLRNPEHIAVDVNASGTLNYVLDPTKLVQFDVFTDGAGVIIDIAAFGTAKKSAVFLFYRHSQTYAFPSIMINGIAVTPFGSTPALGNGHTAMLLVEYFPGSGYVSAFNHVRWISGDANSGSSSAGFSSAVIGHGTLTTGSTLHIPADGSQPAHFLIAHSGANIDFDYDANASSHCCEIFVSISLLGTVPNITNNSNILTIAGTPPANGSVGILKATFCASYASFAWLPNIWFPD